MTLVSGNFTFMGIMGVSWDCHLLWTLGSLAKLKSLWDSQSFYASWSGRVDIT